MHHGERPVSGQTVAVVTRHSMSSEPSTSNSAMKRTMSFGGLSWS
jgi:hypothetical protein